MEKKSIWKNFPEMPKNFSEIFIVFPNGTRPIITTYFDKDRERLIETKFTKWALLSDILAIE